MPSFTAVIELDLTGITSVLLCITLWTFPITAIACYICSRLISICDRRDQPANLVDKPNLSMSLHCRGSLT